MPHSHPLPSLFLTSDEPVLLSLHCLIGRQHLLECQHPALHVCVWLCREQIGWFVLHLELKRMFPALCALKTTTVLPRLPRTSISYLTIWSHISVPYVFQTLCDLNAEYVWVCIVLSMSSPFRKQAKDVYGESENPGQLWTLWVRFVYTKRQWLIWSVSINTCIISDQLGVVSHYWSDSLALLRNLSNSIRAISLATLQHWR